MGSSWSRRSPDRAHGRGHRTLPGNRRACGRHNSPQGPGPLRPGSSPAHSTGDRSAVFASARLGRRRPPALVRTDPVGRLPTIAVAMSNPFRWRRPASRAPLVLVIRKRNVITCFAGGAIEITVMTLPSIQPQPCTDSNCRGQHAPAERVALAMSLCDARGAQLTTLRRQVLELLWESGRPTGAYELIEALKLRNSRRVGPPTIYRALEFLMSQRFVLEDRKPQRLRPLRASGA